MMPISTPRIVLANGTAPTSHIASPAMNGQYMPVGNRGDMDPGSSHSLLEFTQQPPDSWYKDQFGRKATFDVGVRRVSRGCSSCTDHRHLNVQLLYESGKIVENQNILRVASGLCLNKDDQSVLAIRIMEVSKNHQNQRFRLQISLPQCPLKPVGAGVTCAVSEPVLVLSKKNKRPVKTDGEDGPNAITIRLKKSKHLTSPTGSSRGSPSSTKFNTPTSQIRAQTNPEFDGITESIPDDDQWGSEVVRFRQPTQGLCLWANAAFNFMHRLQWQHRVEPTPDGVGEGPVFRCPVCQATYSSRPMHHIECDLALLLEQTGSLDENETENSDKFNSRSPATAESDFSSPDRSLKPSARPSLPQLSQSLYHAKQSGHQPGFTGTSVDMLAKNLNLTSWEGYSSLSKIMFSLEADVKHTKESDAFNGVGRRELKTSDVSMNSSLGSGGSLWSFATAPPPPHGQMSLNFSSILSSVKGLSPDTAAFLQEQEAELTGDASLLKSLSKVSLSDFLLDGQPDRDGGNHAASEAVRSTVASLSTVMMDESKSHVTENAVMAIASIDFRHCGHPAFDSTFSLVGFYFLSSTKNQPELRFLPNFYPLPGQMLQDLDAHLTQWKQQGSTILHTRSDATPAGLDRLKAEVLHALI